MAYGPAANTTIQVSVDTRKKLARFKEYARETWDEVLQKLIATADLHGDEEGELSDETFKAIRKGREEYSKGKTVSLSRILKELGD